MPFRDQTQMGGGEGAFRTTQWTQVLAMRDADDARRREALDVLIRRYWKCVYCFLRRKGYPNEKAKDLTQGFFLEVVFGRDLIAQADRTKGRFRTFLLTALERYVVDVHRFESARRRMPKDGLAALDAVDAGAAANPRAGQDPAEAFHYVWAKTLLNEVLAELEDEYRRSGKAAHWSVFLERVVRPILEGGDPPALGALCERFGVDGEARASNMIVTAKRRFRSILRRRVSDCVASDGDVDQEIAELMRILSAGRAGW